MARRTSAILFLVTVLATVNLHAQLQEKSTEQDPFAEFDRSRAFGLTSLQTPSRAVPLESTIDPAQYFVGPSDVLAVNLWSNPPISYTLTVSPEGTLIIPTVGEVKVADTTLAAAKRRVTAAVRLRYRTGDITVTLVTPRPVVVMVSGRVLNPGSYVLAAYSRVDKAVEEANKLQRTQGENLAAQQYILATMSSRNILVKHKDGSSSRADLPLFRATKEDRWNPYLREGDNIVVPRNDYLKNVIGVYGEVNVPGRYEYVTGDRLSTALRIAYGFTEHALRDSVELSRLGHGGEHMSRHFFSGAAVLAGSGEDFLLQPGDRIVVRGRTEARADYRVIVTGEVVHPGTYPITRNMTRLSEVVAAAGGFTPQASLKTSQLIRRSVNPTEIDLERLESLRGGVTPEDSAYYYLETALRIQKENVSVDFEALFARGDTTADVYLQTEDEVQVPMLRSTIYVFGQVVSPGHVGFRPGESYEFYIAQAGGFTERARSGDAKIVKAKTRQWLSPSETTVEEGDYVWVPKDPEYPFGYYLNTVAQVAAVLSVALSVVLLTVQISQN